jgi:hypothetical protein
MITGDLDPADASHHHALDRLFDGRNGLLPANGELERLIRQTRISKPLALVALGIS